MRIVGQLVMYLVYIQYIAVHEAYQSSDWPKDPCLQSPCESESRLQRIMATITTTTSPPQGWNTYLLAIKVSVLTEQAFRSIPNNHIIQPRLF